MLEEKIKNISVSPGTSILVALKQMDEQNRRLLIVFDKGKFNGLISIGDIQRAIIRNIPLNSPIKSIMRISFTTASDNEDAETIKSRMLESRIEFIPVLDKNRELVKVFFWEDFFPGSSVLNKKVLNLPVAIMAGGRGTRLQPLTNLIPKPLLPYGKTTILQKIIDNFIHNGSKDFYLSIFYKAQLIKDYFENRKEGTENINISFIEENEPLGSAGSLSFLKKVISGSLWVSNCDIIINEDYSLIHDYHVKNGNDLTIVAAVKQLNIPYGIIETKRNGILKSYVEKPDFVYKINSGMYIVEPSVLEKIPGNKFYSFTDLINDVRKGGRIGVFPVSESSWKDIGSSDKYYSGIEVPDN